MSSGFKGVSLVAGKVRQEVKVQQEEVELEDILAAEAVLTVARGRGFVL